MSQPISFSFNPATTAASTDIALPAGIPPLAKLIGVDLVNMAAAPAVTTAEVPQAVAPTATGQSYLSGPGKIQIGDAVTKGEDRIFVIAQPAGEDPAGAVSGGGARIA